MTDNFNDSYNVVEIDEMGWVLFLENEGGVSDFHNYILISGTVIESLESRVT